MLLVAAPPAKNNVAQIAELQYPCERVGENEIAMLHGALLQCKKLRSHF